MRHQNYTRIGCTGPRDGITQPQLLRVVEALKVLRDERGAEFLHHGDCKGADQQIAEMARTMNYTLVCHPPIWPVYRAFVASDEMRAEKEYHPRNRDIVDETELLLATPKTQRPTVKSGTWYTVGYAQSLGRPVTLIFPDGSWDKA